MNGIWLVLNGEAAEDPRLQDAIEAAREAGHGLELLTLSEGRNGTDLAREAVALGAQVVVAAGGDGTLNEVVTGLLEVDSPCALGILPYGTGNDFATAAGIPLDDPAAALEGVLSTPAQAIDVGVCNGKPFLNMATGGFPATLTTEVDPGVKSWLGRMAYAVHGVMRLGALESQPARLEAEDARWEGSLYAFAVGNGRQAGGGVTATPWACVDDGFLDVLVVPEETDESLLALVLDHRRLQQDAPPERLLYWRVRHLEVSAPEPLQVNLDGQPTEARRYRFEVRPGALRVHLPEDSPLVRPAGPDASSGLDDTDP